MLSGRAIFINSTITKTPARASSFDAGKHFIGRDNVDWWLAGATGDALVARWFANGMREIRVSWKGCKGSPIVLANDVYAGRELADWLTVDMGSNQCAEVLFAQMRIPLSDSWNRCRLNAFMRPRPAIQSIVHTIFQSARQNACGETSYTQAQPILVAVQLRTGTADGMDTFATNRVGGPVSWTKAEASFQSMPDRLGLTTESSRKRARGPPLAVRTTNRTIVKFEPRHRMNRRRLRSPGMLNPSAFDFKCVGPLNATTNVSHSLLAAFGGLKRFVECALVTSKQGVSIPRSRVTLSGWRPDPAPESTPQTCGVTSRSAEACPRQSIFVSTDSTSLNQLLMSSFEHAIETADVAGRVGHSLISFKRLGFKGTNTTDVISMRTVVDWIVLSMVDVLFSASAHFVSSFVSSALERSMLTTSHVEYFDGLAKYICARSGLCSLTAKGQGDCGYVRAELARARAKNITPTLFERCVVE